MRPTFLGFESAKRGIAVNQKGLDIVSNNIMNLQTEGYSRQRVDTYAMGLDTYSSRYATSRIDLAGQGVGAGGISQIRDSFLDKRFREEYGDVGYYQTTQGILSDIEGVLNEFGLNTAEDNPNGTGLENALVQIQKALNTFADQADSKTYANILKSSVKNMVDVLNQFSGKLSSVAEQSKFDLSVAVTDVNSILSKVADLNASIVKDVAVTRSTNGEYYGPNELMDERNLLLDQLAAFADTTVESNSDGSVTVKMNGRTVVEGKKFDMMNLSYNNNGTVAINWQSDGKTVNLQSGSLKGFLDIINGRGVNAQLTGETPYNGIRYYQDKVNGFAYTFANVINNIIPATTVNDAGETVIIRGKYRTLVQSTTALTDSYGNVTYTDQYPVTAENITISDEWEADAAWVIFEDGNLDSRYIMQMKDALGNGSYTFRSSTDVGDGSFKGTFIDYIEDYVLQQSSQTASSGDRLNAVSEIATDLENRRDEVSGVSQDEETVNMMMFQKAYQASARIMTVLDDLLDTLINRTGRVGL